MCTSIWYCLYSSKVSVVAIAGANSIWASAQVTGMIHGESMAPPLVVLLKVLDAIEPFPGDLGFAFAQFRMFGVTGLLTRFEEPSKSVESLAVLLRGSQLDGIEADGVLRATCASHIRAGTQPSDG